MKINLGCGKDIMSDAVNVDFMCFPGVDVVHDLSKYPYPFPDDYADCIIMNSVIEHLPDTTRVMEEVHRILKPGGVVRITTTYWNHHDSISNPQHCSFFDEKKWSFYTRGASLPVSRVLFDLVSFEYQYDYHWKYVPVFIKRRLGMVLCNVIAGMVVELRK